LSTDGLIRVGGRLALSSMDYAEKHPVVLAKDSHLSLLLVREVHALALHGEPQLTRSVLSRFYWIVQANRLIRSEIKQCMQCAKAKGATAQQQMGHLPQVRVRAAKPFWSLGVDYAGPIWVRDQTGRGRRSYKAVIISVFSFVWQLRLFIWNWYQIFPRLHLLKHCDGLWQFEVAVPDFTVITALILRVLSENYDSCFELRRNFMRDVAASWTKDE